MSKYYGTLQTDKGTTTRAGNIFIQASAQSHDGSVTVEITDGRVAIYFQEGSGSGTGGHRVYFGNLADFKRDGFVLRRSRRNKVKQRGE